jgi:uncharacterized protein YciI
MNTLPPIRRAILVEADPAAAFEVFTAGLGRWWPLGELSVHGKDATVAFGRPEPGAQIIERSAGGETAVWGTVTRWEPPDAVAFTWHPGRHPDEAGYVEVTFIAGAPGQTMVRLEHSGWELFADPAAARAEYDQGWPHVLDRYQEHIAAKDADEDADTWVALLHRPGPQAPAAGPLTEDPRFGEHLAFLGRMREAGYLVLAGPLADADGEGMTVLRLPGPGRLGTATRLANEDDTSVASGFLSVTVRPWLVVMRGA